MTMDWSPLAELLRSHDRFIVTTHVRPDGDALGSALGMAGILATLDKDAVIVNSSPMPPRYEYLDAERRLFRRFGNEGALPADFVDRQVLIILDLSSWTQLGQMAEFVAAFPGPRVVIDHHVSGDDLGALVCKDTAAEATGTLVFELAKALGVPIDARMATGLFTALAMDTGWFRHPTTSPRTFRMAAELVEAGADANRVYRLLFERNTAGRLRMLGAALAALKTDADGRIAYTCVTREDFIRTGAVPPDTEDLVDFTVSLRDVEVGMLFIEQPRGGIKLSLRSRGDVDVANVAQGFGGGGHRAAAGANLPDPLAQAIPNALAAVRQSLSLIAV